MHPYLSSEIDVYLRLPSYENTFFLYNCFCFLNHDRNFSVCSLVLSKSLFLSTLEICFLTGITVCLECKVISPKLQSFLGAFTRNAKSVC
jgi:hypothetical protein